MTGRDGLEVQVNLGSFSEVAATVLERAVRVSFAAEGKDRGEVSLTLMDDEGIRRLNREYLGRDHVTDVIAFSLGSGEFVVGDVYIGFQQAERQAAEWGVSKLEEVVRLAVHGALHVLGQDHPEGMERTESPMFRAQEALVSRIMEAGPEA